MKAEDSEGQFTRADWYRTVARLALDNRQLLEQLTIVQTRCTELIAENRKLRGIKE